MNAFDNSVTSVLSVANNLQAALRQARRIAVVGIGSDLRGDDCAGLLVLRELRAAAKRSRRPARPASSSARLRLFDGGAAPENLTGAILRFKPSHVLLVDAADLGLPPGAARLIAPEAIAGIPFSTHVLPLKILADYLAQAYPCQVIVLGLQPGRTDFGAEVSGVIRLAARRLARAIQAAASAAPAAGSVPEPAERLTILHVDMDAFYAAVEALDHPEWRGLPLVVGAAPDQRGVVATCSYEARRFGIHSAMPSRTAGKLCPQAIFAPPRMERYAEISARIMAICEEFTPLVEPLALDEAFLDVSGTLKIFGDAAAIARELKARLKARLGLTASVGVAPNKFLAKLASEINKPDGLTVVPATEPAIMAFLAPLPATKLWGIGKVAGARLAREGIRTIGQLQALAPAALERLFGKAGARDLAELARGRDRRPVLTHWEEKSISQEYTFPQDEPDLERVRQRLLELTEAVGRRLRQSGKLAGSAQIKLRFGDFSTITRQRSFPAALDSDRPLIACALDLFERERVQRPIRLVGFGVHKLKAPDQAGPAQPELFAELPGSGRDGRNKKLDQAVDALRHSFGSAAIRRGKWHPAALGRHPTGRDAASGFN